MYAFRKSVSIEVLELLGTHRDEQWNSASLNPSSAE